MELFPDVITVDSLVLVQPSSKTKAELVDYATDHVRIFSGISCNLIDECALIRHGGHLSQETSMGVVFQTS